MSLPIPESAPGALVRGKSPVADVAGFAAREARRNLAGMYRAWFGHVVKWLQTLGAPRTDSEDLAQEVFLVARRRLDDFDGLNTAGWLYRIASRRLRQHRRRFWFRAEVSCPEDGLADLPDARRTALSQLEMSGELRRLEEVLARMSEKRRTVFLLSDIQGYSGQEVSAMLGVPINTVKSRLHLARKDMVRLVGEIQASAESGGGPKASRG